MTNKTDQNQGFTTTGRVTLMWPCLYEPKKYKDPKTQKEQGEPKYSVTILIPNDEVKRLWAHAMGIAIEAFPDLGDLLELSQKGLFNWPFKAGAKLKVEAEKKGKNGDFYEGRVVLKADSIFAPKLMSEYKVDLPNGLTDDVGLFYSGVQVACALNFSTYEYGGTPGIKAYLDGVMKITDGPRLTGRDMGEAFADIEGAIEQDDPTGGAAAVDFDPSDF